MVADDKFSASSDFPDFFSPAIVPPSFGLFPSCTLSSVSPCLCEGLDFSAGDPNWTFVKNK